MELEDLKADNIKNIEKKDEENNDDKSCKNILYIGKDLDNIEKEYKYLDNCFDKEETLNDFGEGLTSYDKILDVFSLYRNIMENEEQYDSNVFNLYRVIEKKKICERYSEELHNDKIILPEIREGATHIWHQYVIRTDCRDELIRYLDENGIGTIIHYPIPPHLSEAYGYLGLKKGSLPVTERYADTVLSIPLYNGMTDEEQDYVIRTINSF